MSALISLHSTDGNSAKVKNFEDEKTGSGLGTRSLESGFAIVSVKDYSGNEVTLFFSNLSEVLNFSLVLKEQASWLLTK